MIRMHTRTTKEVEIDEVDQKTVFLIANKSEIFDNWRECAKFKLMGFQDPVEFWKQFVELSRKCDEESGIYKLGLVEIENMNEQKVVILPKNDDENSNNLVTLGIGQDTTGEERYQRKMQKLGKTVKFFGADPMVELNSEIYSRIGKYFPFAVARHPGYTNASVEKNGEFTDQNVAHVDILYFIKQILDIEKIDNLWIDAEGAEYELFDIFEKNGVLDQNDITVCQVNLEVHIADPVGHQINPNIEKQKIFLDFVKKIITEKKYGIFHAVEEFHMKIYLFNFESDYCRNKF